jgi:hypothetical protein
VSEKLHKLQLDPGATTPEETRKFFDDELALWGKVIARAHITVQ